MFKDNFIVDLLLFERKTTVNKFYALMITAGVIASGVVGCGGEAPKKDDKKNTPVAPAKKEEGKKEKASEVKKEEKAPEVKKEEKKEDKK